MQSEERVIYENTRLDTKGIGTNQIKLEVDKSKTSHSDNALNRIKCLLIIMLVMMIILYVAVFVFIIIFAINIPVNQVNGEWAAWSAWSSCDVTCGNGSRSRSRTCTNPTPTSNGMFCAGSFTDISVCQLSKCLDERSDTDSHHVSFSARLVNRYSVINRSKLIVFNTVTANNMNGYDKRSGIFKAPASGVYLFMYFIQIIDAYGEVELRVDNKSVSATTLHGVTADVVVTGEHNYATFQNTKLNGTESALLEGIRCLGGRYVVTGSNNTAKFLQDIDRCDAYGGDEIKTAGGNSVVIFVHTGSQVWVQNSGSLPIHIHPDGTTFLGVLLTEN